MDKETLLKVKELAERGKGGEREAAQRILHKELARLGMTADELDQDYGIALRKYAYHFKNNAERFILMQTRFKVVDRLGETYWINSRARRITFELTAEQADEVTVLYAIYRKALKREIERTVEAFVQKNQIWGRATESYDPNELTPEELAELEALANRASTIDQVEVPLPKSKRLEAGDEVRA